MRLCGLFIDFAVRALMDTVNVTFNQELEHYSNTFDNPLRGMVGCRGDNCFVIKGFRYCSSIR